jgi:hypothetical protein
MHRSLGSSVRSERQRLELTAARVHRRAVRALDRVRHIDEQVVRRVVPVVARRDLLHGSASGSYEYMHPDLESDGANRRRVVDTAEPVRSLVAVVVLEDADLVLREVWLDAILKRTRVVRRDLDRLKVTRVRTGRDERRGTTNIISHERLISACDDDRVAEPARLGARREDTAGDREERSESEESVHEDVDVRVLVVPGLSDCVFRDLAKSVKLHEFMISRVECLVNDGSTSPARKWPDFQVIYTQLNRMLQQLIEFVDRHGVIAYDEHHLVLHVHEISAKPACVVGKPHLANECVVRTRTGRGRAWRSQFSIERSGRQKTQEAAWQMIGSTGARRVEQYQGGSRRGHEICLG